MFDFIQSKKTLKNKRTSVKSKEKEMSVEAGVVSGGKRELSVGNVHQNVMLQILRNNACGV